jgi:hypothetical protein
MTKKRHKRTYNDLRDTTHKTKDSATRNSIKNRGCTQVLQNDTQFLPHMSHLSYYSGNSYFMPIKHKLILYVDYLLLFIYLKISFQVEVEVKECRKGPRGYSHRFYIKPVGLPDKVEVRMEVICECDCEKSSIYVSIFFINNCNNFLIWRCHTYNILVKCIQKVCISVNKILTESKHYQFLNYF